MSFWTAATCREGLIATGGGISLKFLEAARKIGPFRLNETVGSDDFQVSIVAGKGAGDETFSCLVSTLHHSRIF